MIKNMDSPLNHQLRQLSYPTNNRRNAALPRAGFKQQLTYIHGLAISYSRRDRTVVKCRLEDFLPYVIDELITQGGDAEGEQDGLGLLLGRARVDQGADAGDVGFEGFECEVVADSLLIILKEYYFLE